LWLQPVIPTLGYRLTGEVGLVGGRRWAFVALVALGVVAVAVGTAPAATPQTGKPRFGTKADCRGRGQCLPSGRAAGTLVFTSGGGGCSFSVTITWGDGSRNTYTTSGSLGVSHQYTQPGVYTQKITGSGIGENCRFHPSTVVVEVPAPKPPPVVPKATDDTGGGGVNPVLFAAILALAAAGLAAAALLVKTHKDANAKQKKELEGVVAEAAAREREKERRKREEQRTLELAEKARLEAARQQGIRDAEEWIARQEHPQKTEDKRIVVEDADLIEEGAKSILPGPVRTGVDLVEKFGEKMSDVTDSPDEIEAKIQQRANELQAETNMPLESCEIEARREYAEAGRSFGRFSEAMVETKHAGADAVSETAQETVQKKVVKKAIKNIQPPRK
jgi:hypothetical protein